MTTPLSERERALVLQFNPGATAADLDALEELLVARMQVVREPESLDRLDQRLADVQQRLFPHFAEALQQAELEEPPPEDGDEEEAPPVA